MALKLNSLLLDGPEGVQRPRLLKGGGCNVVPSQVRKTTENQDARRSEPTKVSEVSFSSLIQENRLTPNENLQKDTRTRVFILFVMVIVRPRLSSRYYFDFMLIMRW